MKSLDIELAVVSMFDVRQHIIVPNISWGANLHECDLLIVTKSNYATEVEIKISKSDLRKDFTKKHNHNSDKIKYLYYAIPEFLLEVALEIVPEKAGIIVVRKIETNSVFYNKASYQRKAISTLNVKQWTDSEILNLTRLGCMRIWNLKRKLKSYYEKTTI